MGSNRRAFLQFASLAPAAVATAGLAAAKSEAPATTVAALTRSSFLPLVGDEFLFESGPFAAKPAKLARVAETGPKADPENSFRLLFEPATVGAIQQETYTVSHPRLGRFALFVSPNDAAGSVVEAVFNRL